MSHERLEKLFPFMGEYLTAGTIGSRESIGERSLRKGEFICHAGEELRNLYLLTEGSARVFLPLYSGNYFLLHIYLSGSIVGDIELFSGEAATCSVQCISDCRAAVLQMAELRRRKERYAPLLFDLGASLAHKLAQNSWSEAINTNYDIITRVAAYYVTHDDEELRAASLKELAEWLGTSYRHLIRVHAQLTEEGALEKQGGRYTVRDRQRLEDRAEAALFEGVYRMV
jgi:CRP-like cAMP-binding protein